MCMWFGFNHAVNFCHFSTVLVFVIFQFFAGVTSTSPKVGSKFHTWDDFRTLELKQLVALPGSDAQAAAVPGSDARAAAPV